MSRETSEIVEEKERVPIKYTFIPPTIGFTGKPIVFKIPEKTDIKSAINYLENKNSD